MPSYYGRQFELFVTNESVPFILATSDRQFKFTFNILIDFGGFNTYADIVIYNLSQDTEWEISNKGDYIGLRAGYEDSIDYIFKGEIVNIIKERNGSNRLTRLICKSGSVSQGKSVINEPFEKNVTLKELCKACADALGFPIIFKDSDFPGESPYLSGYTLSGDPKKILGKLAKAHGFDWIIESNKIVIVAKKSSRGVSPIVVSASNGMVGIPELTEVGVDVTTRINPALKIGGEFRIKAEFGKVNFSNVYFQDVPDTLGEGTYTIQKLQHEGDSYGDAWNTKITGVRK